MTRPAVLLLCLALLPFGLAAKERVYRWTDANGVVHYAQIEPDKIKSEARDVRTSKGQPVVKAKSFDERACERARLNAELLAGSAPLTVDKNGDGKPETMSPEARKAEKALSARQITAYCKGS